MIEYYRGLKEKYNSLVHGGGIYFTTDTHEIIANNSTYGEAIDSWTLADGVLTLTMASGKILEITFDEATENTKGLLSATDKKKINSIDTLMSNKVDKVAGKSLVSDTEISKLANLPSKTDLDSAIADAKKAGTDVQTNLTTHISNTSNPHKVTKAQVGLGNVTNDAQVKRTEMGVANGVATLDENGTVPASLLPSFVDDVLEYNKLGDFPVKGESGKIYVALDTNLTYRWSGSAYVEISQSLALGETSSTAYAGDKGADTTSKVNSIRNTSLSHIKDTNTFSTTTEKVNLNFDCYVGDQYGSTGTSHSVSIPVASTTQAGIITATDKIAITNMDSTYAKLTDVDSKVKELQKAIDAGGTAATLSIEETSSSTYAKSYLIKQGTSEIGTINIPKDMVVSSGSVEVVTESDVPYTGAKIGDKYIDLVIANSSNQHIYIPLSDLASAYSAGDGLTLSNSTFSIKKDSASESYLTVTSSGIKVTGIDNALSGKVDKVTGKSLVDDTEISKLSELPTKTDLDSAITDAKKAGTDAQSNINTHKADTSNPHKVTKDLVGLGNVDNTADKNKPISDATQEALNNKVDKITGKSLSTNDYTTDEKNKLAGIETGANNYSLPEATSSVLGGVKTGDNITNTSGTISITKNNVISALGYTPTEGTTYTVETIGEGSALTDISLSGTTITATKGDISYEDLTNKPTIPTKTSDLTNDSDFVTSDEAATKEWIEEQGYAKASDFKETVNISLATNQSSSDDLIGATITVTNDGSTLNTYTWNGEQISFSVKGGLSLTVSVSAKDGYKTPDDATFTTMEGNVRTLTMTYSTEVVSVSLASNQDSTGADLKGATVTVNGTSVGTWQGTALTAKVPYGTAYKVSAGAVSNYKTPSEASYTAGQASRNVTMTYNTEVVTISLSTNQGEAVTSGTSVKVMSGSTTLHTLTWKGSALTAKVAYDTSYTVVVGDMTDYKTPTMDARKAQAATNAVSLEYQTEVLTVTVKASDDTSVAGQVITVNGTAHTYSEPFTVRIPFGTEYSISADAKTMYSTPATQTITANSKTRSVTLTYTYQPTGVYILHTDGSLITADNWNTSDNAKAVGVAVLTDDCRFVIAPEYNTSKTWGGYGTTVSGIVTTSDSATAKKDFAGETNTDKIIAQLGSGNAPAAEYCRNYTFKNGKKGYLPSLGELYAAYSNKSAIDTAMSKIGGTAMGTNDYHWSSTQYSSDYSWLLLWDDGAIDGGRKDYDFYVRAVCAF